MNEVDNLLKLISKKKIGSTHFCNSMHITNLRWKLLKHFNFLIFRLNEEGGGMLNMENEKRMRREIANSNERRRMQSINAGFQSLRSLLPHHEGEKLSKVSSLISY